MSRIAAIAFVAALPTSLSAQESLAPRLPFAVSLADTGVVVDGRAEALSAEDEPSVRIRSPDGAARRVALAKILAFHGPPPRDAQPAARVRLVGGDELVGALRAGDAEGETLVVRSAVLGDVRVAIDRLDRIEFPERARGVAPAAFDLPEGVDEAVFLRAERGLDTRPGQIHRFLDAALLFGAGDAADPPGELDYDDLVAIALRDGLTRENAPSGLLVTRAGDRVGVDLVALDGFVFTLRLEGGDEARVGLEDVSALTLLGEDRSFLSDLPIAAADERGFFEADDPLLPFRRDAAVSGGCLAVGGRAFGKGLGVHSRSELTWTVPEGAGRFWALVGIDDAVRELGVRGDARVAVWLDGTEKFAEPALRGGRPATSIGPLVVRPGQELRLEVDFGGGLDLGDRVDWLHAVFLR